MLEEKGFAKGAKRKFLFLYLTTGAGHISTARVLKEQILKQNPDAEIVMVNGFDRKNFFGKAMFEHGYFVATNALHGAFPLIYDLSAHRPLLTFFGRAFAKPHDALFGKSHRQGKPHRHSFVSFRAFHFRQVRDSAKRKKDKFQDRKSVV